MYAYMYVLCVCMNVCRYLCKYVLYVCKVCRYASMLVHIYIYIYNVRMYVFM